MLMIHLPLVWLSRDQIEKSLKAESNLEPLREEKNNMLGKSTWLVMCTAVLATAVTSSHAADPSEGGAPARRGSPRLQRVALYQETKSMSREITVFQLRKGWVMGRGLRFPKWAAQSERRNCRSRQTTLGPSVYHRRLMCEALEDRRLLSIGSPQLELFSASPALFAANQGQWADPAVRYVFQGDGANVAMTDAGPVFQVFQQPATTATASPSVPANPLDRCGDANGSGHPVRTVLCPLRRCQPRHPDGHGSGGDGFQLPHRRSVAVAYQRADLSEGGLQWPLRGHRPGDLGPARQLEVRVPRRAWGRLPADPHPLRRHRGAFGRCPGRVARPDRAGRADRRRAVIYQEIGGQQVAVAGQFKLLDADTYTFTITGSYDPTRELVIDPDLAWSTYLGGSGDDVGYGIAVDAAGNAYVTGCTDSSNFPTTAGACDTTYNGGSSDVFVAKLNASGSGLVYSTYLGGSGHDDYGSGIAVDAAGNAYVTGYTYSSDFPTTAGALDRTYNGGGDVFVAKLNASGSGLVYSTYLGEAAVSTSRHGHGIAVDAAGNAYVTG